MFDMVKYPEELGISSKKLLEFIERVEANRIEIHSAILMRHGKIACRMNWEPYGLDRPHMLFSLSKSFTSCAAGFAVAEGLLDWNTRLADVLTDKLPDAPSERLLKITLDDLLKMGSGLDPKSDCTPHGDADWAKHVLTYEVTDEPGTRFNYNSMGTYLVSAMITRVTGQTCRDYLQTRLFDKIGIAKPEWDESPQGINCGGWGLHLSCEDIAKFGTLLLQKGMWNGERVLPEGWVETATKSHIDNSGRGAHVDWEQGYGYQFWRCRDGRYRGDGMCGQYCLVSESEDVVLAMTAGVVSMDTQMDAMHDLLLAAIDADPDTEAEQKRLQERLASLNYPWPRDDGSRSDIDGCWVSDDGAEIDIASEGGLLNISFMLPVNSGIPLAVQYGTGLAAENNMISLYRLADAPKERALAACGWHDGKLTAVMRLVNGPFMRVDELELSGDTLRDSYFGAGFGEGETVYRRK